MLTSVEPGRSRSRIGFAVSAAVHCVFLGVMAYRPAPPLLMPAGSLHGEGGRGSLQMLYFPGRSVSDPRQQAELRDQKLTAPPKARKRHEPAQMPEPAASAPDTTQQGRPGNPWGTLSSGISSSHDVRIALPVFAPEPPVVRSRLPEGLQGDVIVEVTIDENGAVVDTRVLQAAGFGLEESIVATLRQWRFSPAKIDGVAVASRQDVRFHFPS